MDTVDAKICLVDDNHFSGDAPELYLLITVNNRRLRVYVDKKTFNQLSERAIPAYEKKVTPESKTTKRIN